MHATLRQAAASDGTLSFHAYSKLALYHPEHGYYCRQRRRVGRSQDADFYTAASLGAVFSELLHGAIEHLLPGPCADYHLVELGVEPGGGVFGACAEQYASHLEIGNADAMDIPSKPVVFANELLDAQPFHRFIVHEGQWRECGVRVLNDGLEECLLEACDGAAQAFLTTLPQRHDGYRLDISLEAEQLLGSIAAQAESGLLLFFDYGKTWTELIDHSPAGTARAYKKHEATRELLDSPGEIDLTCHVCWDRLEDVLKSAGWTTTLESQEAFFVKRATAAVEKIIMQPGTGIDTRKQTLKELIYPGHMGQSFQVLWATR